MTSIKKLLGLGKHRKLKGKELDALESSVGFSREEIQEWHKEFRKTCKRGRYLTIDEFRKVYNKLFPGDVNTFAQHMFRSFDKDGNGRVDFQEFLIGLSVSSSSDIEQKLRWAFDMYDVDGNGTISRSEMMDILNSVYKMTDLNAGDGNTPEKMTERLFKKMDTNGDGELSWEEFLEGAKQDSMIVNMLTMEPDPTQ
ncbi:hypothetical protein ScPMuIL_001926 [Solemya velum]